jgi:hypothetical protein
MFFKEKRTGIIKERICVDGRKKQSLITTENSSSPTVSFESLLLTCVIDAMERRYIATTGSIWSSSIKQKLNTRRSTEAELVAMDDIMLKMLWTRYFLMNQGFNVGPSRILKDNKSAMLLEENGMESSSKQPCHIHISFYFVTDQVHLNNVTIEHCPTKSIVADFFTKPLQGSAFYEFRKAIMELPY